MQQSKLEEVNKKETTKELLGFDGAKVEIDPQKEAKERPALSLRTSNKLAGARPRE